MQFSEVVGQTELKHRLGNMVIKHRVSHALLFLGKEGSGALNLARAFAQFLVCDKNHATKAAKTAVNDLFGNPGSTEDSSSEGQLTDSCGDCSSCKKAGQLVHPDIHFSYPVITKKAGDRPISTDFITEWREFVSAQPYGNSFDWLQYIGAENKQGNITSRECEEILHKLSLKSFEGGHKILIMWMPELLGKEGNKLLKLIEEPPPDTIFLLVTENDSLLLPTILSRTQLIRVPMLSATQVEAALESKYKIPAEKARQAAEMSSGNFREALSHLQNDADDYEKSLRDWLNCIVKTNQAAQVKWVEGISKTGREKQKQFLKYFAHLLERALRLSVLQTAIPEATEDPATNFARRINKVCDPGQLEALSSELDKSAYYIERNANAKILFHALTIRLHYIINNKSVILVQ